MQQALARKDYYKEDPSRLEGMPKLTIGRKLRLNHHVAPFYESFEGAKKHGKDILARSEHAQDYDGASDLFKTLRFKKEIKDIDEAQIKEMGVKSSMPNIETYCKLTGYDKRRLIEQLSYSYWEHLPGVNLSIVADSSIFGRYHILCFMESPVKQGAYFDFDNGKITEHIFKNSGDLRSMLKDKLHELIKIYEAIRNEETFNPLHCPIMEFQYNSGEFSWLQYHRTRDFEPVDFVLDRPIQKGEFEAQFVRGATRTINGELFKTVVYYSDDKKDGYWPSGTVMYEAGASDLDYSGMNNYDEIMAKRRGLQLINLEGAIDYKLACFTNNHKSKSRIFKPRVSLVLPIIGTVLSEKEKEKRIYSVSVLDDEGKPVEDQLITVRVISDGRRAFVKRVD